MSADTPIAGTDGARHTPGPWHVERPRYGSGHTREVWAGRSLVALVPTQGSYGYQDKSNAALIASAPDLLAALTALQPIADCYSGDAKYSTFIEAQCYALAAIAKALGQ